MPSRKKSSKPGNKSLGANGSGSGSTTGISDILEHVRSARGFDAVGYCTAVMETRVQSRLSATGKNSYGDYLRFIETSPVELDFLVEALTIKVSSFFRDPLAFEYLGECILPALLAEKAASSDRTLRVWSAGCANGEEPYSVAILLHDLTRRDNHRMDTTIFATDIDEKALANGREAIYSAASLANVRRGLLETSFERQGEYFHVLPAIARMVRFSVHDMLDRRTASPAESVFGTFDLILCRNLLIYFQRDCQDVICEKLYRSLAAGGYLLLGRAESIAEPCQASFRRASDCCSIYQRPIRSGKPAATGVVGEQQSAVPQSKRDAP